MNLFAYPSAGLLRLAWSEGLVTSSDYHAAHLSERPAVLESALTKMEVAWAGDAPDSGNPATSLLFAVPVTGSTPRAFWERVLASVPGHRPSAVERGERFLTEPME